MDDSPLIWGIVGLAGNDRGRGKYPYVGNSADRFLKSKYSLRLSKQSLLCERDVGGWSYGSDSSAVDRLEWLGVPPIPRDGNPLYQPQMR